jgi:hypothetical protein
MENTGLAGGGVNSTIVQICSGVDTLRQRSLECGLTVGANSFAIDQQDPHSSIVRNIFRE